MKDLRLENEVQAEAVRLAEAEAVMQEFVGKIAEQMPDDCIHETNAEHNAKLRQAVESGGRHGGADVALMRKIKQFLGSLSVDERRYKARMLSHKDYSWFTVLGWDEDWRVRLDLLMNKNLPFFMLGLFTLDENGFIVDVASALLSMHADMTKAEKKVMEQSNWDFWESPDVPKWLADNATLDMLEFLVSRADGDIRPLVQDEYIKRINGVLEKWRKVRDGNCKTRNTIR